MTDAKCNALNPEAKSKLIEKQKAAKAAKATVTGKTAKSLDNKDNDDCSVGLTKSMADLQKDNVRRLKQQLKSTKAALVTAISEGNKSDLSDNEGSSNFNATMVMVQEKYPDLHDGIVLAHTMKALHLREVILINSQTTHDVFCNDEYVKTFLRP